MIYNMDNIRRCSFCGSTNRVASFRGGALYCMKHYLQMYSHGACCDEKKRKAENTIIRGAMESKIITSTNDVIIVDTDILPILSEYTWCLNTQGYPVSRTKGKYVRLNRLLMDCDQALVVDHINGNRLDNRRSNLRVCEQVNNSRNKGIGRNNQSGVLGVSKRPDGKWRVRIMVDRSEIALGVYGTFEKAVEARREAEKYYFGDYARGGGAV